MLLISKTQRMTKMEFLLFGAPGYYLPNLCNNQSVPINS